MQIMPTFAYLVPFVLLFGIGPAAAAIVTLIYAMPAAIRITALGIRGVPVNTVEAGRSLGATGRQLLTEVKLPMARKELGPRAQPDDHAGAVDDRHHGAHRRAGSRAGHAHAR